MRAPDVRQVGPLTLHFLGFVLFFATLQMTYSGRGAYADYDGADMWNRLTPGWGGELSWELGRVLMGALAATAVIDGIARLLANLGWPMVSPSLQRARRRSKTRRERAVQAGFALVVPLSAALVPSLLFGYLMADSVPENWPLMVVLIWWLAVFVFIVIAGWTGYGHLRIVLLKKPDQRPIINKFRNGILLGMFAALSIFAGMVVMDFTERAFRVRVYSNKEAVRLRLVTCSIGADEKLTVTGLVANIGTRLAALDLHARVSMDGRGVDLVLNAAPTDGPMLVLKAGEGKAFTFINDPNYDPHPLWEKSYENKACWLNWKVLGPDKISDYWGRIDDHRAPKK